MEKKYFKDFFLKFPFEFSEHMVIKQIHKALECAEKKHKEHPEDVIYMKYLSKAYYMLEAYFVEKNVHPEQYK